VATRTTGTLPSSSPSGTPITIVRPSAHPDSATDRATAVAV